jgi:hypothetical protein
LFLVTERAYARAPPTVPSTSDLAGAVQDGCDRRIGHLTSQNTNEFDDIGAGGPARLASLVLLYIELGVVSAVPMNEGNDGIICNIDNDLRDQQSNHFLEKMLNGSRITDLASFIGFLWDSGKQKYSRQNFLDRLTVLCNVL